MEIGIKFKSAENRNEIGKLLAGIIQNRPAENDVRSIYSVLY